MKVPIVYIAGPYLGSIKPEHHNASSYLDIDDNIGEARRAAVYLAQHQIGFFCPHMNSAHFEVMAPEASVDYWYQMDLAILEWCDAILMLPNWEESTGAKKELEFAKELGLPVFLAEYTMDALIDWHTKRISEQEV